MGIAIALVVLVVVGGVVIWAVASVSKEETAVRNSEDV